MYTKKLYAGWADMDSNSHMRNTAYLDKAADVRQTISFAGQWDDRAGTTGTST